MKESSQTNRLILAILAVVVGLFMVIVATILTQISMERVVASLVQVSQERPQYSSGVPLFSVFYPLWRAFIFVGGIALILMAFPIHKGREWTYPAGLLASAFPSAGGMFMFLPYVSWVEGFPIPMVICWVGLAFFWSLIFLRHADKWEKWAHFFALTFAGMLATHAFVVGVDSLRTLMTRPGQPLFEGLEWQILTVVGPVNWLCVLLLIISIPLLANKKLLGRWLPLISAVSILAINVPTQFIRTKTLDYPYGSLLAIGLLFFLLFPKFKKALLGENP
jgi:hypothetical protein